MYVCMYVYCSIMFYAVVQTVLGSLLASMQSNTVLTRHTCVNINTHATFVVKYTILHYIPCTYRHTNTHSMCKRSSLHCILCIQAKESTEREEESEGDSSQSLPLIKYSVTMSAPEVVLPTSDGGAIVLDMGQVALDNKLEYKERNSVAMSTFKAKLSHVQIHRLNVCIICLAAIPGLWVPVFLCDCIPV